MCARVCVGGGGVFLHVPSKYVTDETAVCLCRRGIPPILGEFPACACRLCLVGIKMGCNVALGTAPPRCLALTPKKEEGNLSRVEERKKERKTGVVRNVGFLVLLYRSSLLSFGAVCVRED